MTLEEQQKGAAEHLAETTDKPKSEFEPDSDDPMPDLDELEWRTLDADESPFSDE